MSDQPAPVTAFDHFAGAYDQQFTHSTIGRWLRRRVHGWLGEALAAGDSVLELGCGTGEDAMQLARRGIRVTATDVSPAMLDVARRKTGSEPSVNIAHLDLNALPVQGFEGPYDGVIANFGPLNCLEEWQGLATWLARRVRSEGLVGLGVMGPLCVWEIGWHGLHGDWQVALRRLRKRVIFQGEGLATGITVRYPSPRRLAREFAPFFELRRVYGLGVFLPPGDVYPVVEKRPRLLSLLTGLESRLAHRWPFIYLGDHYWLELRRTAAGE